MQAVGQSKHSLVLQKEKAVCSVMLLVECRHDMINVAVA